MWYPACGVCVFAWLLSLPGTGPRSETSRPHHLLASVTELYYLFVVHMNTLRNRGSCLPLLQYPNPGTSRTGWRILSASLWHLHLAFSHSHLLIRPPSQSWLPSCLLWALSYEKTVCIKSVSPLILPEIQVLQMQILDQVPRNLSTKATFEKKFPFLILSYFIIKMVVITTWLSICCTGNTSI